MSRIDDQIAAAEAALPEGWHIYSLHRSLPREPLSWSVVAHEDADLTNTIIVHNHRGSLASALDALSLPEARKWVRLTPTASRL